jgi:4-amino-4-deoxy-L-arabinose transferase-like glycosyltransferase
MGVTESTLLSPSTDSLRSAPPRAEVTERSTHAWLLGCVIVAGSLFRLVALGAFPSINVDEGLWTRSTKNHVLFGDWFLDRHTHLFLSPLFHWLSIPTFRVFGPTIVAGRLISGVAGSVSIWLLYVLVRRLTVRPRLALIAAAILACSEWSILQSREALIESLELCLILACATALTFDGWFALLGAGALFGLVLLTKINALFMALPFAFLILQRVSTTGANPLKSVRSWSRVIAFGLVSMLVAGAVYYSLFRVHPQEFRAAFKFELDGVHFESISNPIVRVGRFGIDPVQEGRTVIALFREEPFLFALAAIGLAMLPWVRLKGSPFFASWFIVGVPYFLGQMYQPTRYFYLVMPAFVFFAALFVDWLAQPGEEPNATSRQVARAAIGVFLAFDLAYAGMNAVANRNTAFRDVRSWLRSNTSPNDKMLVSAMLATDLPNEAFAYYKLVHTAADIDPVVRQLHVNYVIVDDKEWPDEYKDEVARRYTKRFVGAHSAVYEVAASGTR